MEPLMSTPPCCKLRRPACSFKPCLHPHFSTIQAECEPWILSFMAPASEAESQFWLGCAFPLLAGLAYAHCATTRVAHLVKLLTWFFVCDSDDDDPAMRGCESEAVLSQRHELLLECYAGHQNLGADIRCKGSAGSHGGSDMMISAAACTDEANHLIRKGLDVLHDIWKDISKDMSPRLLSRYLDAMRDHLNGNRLQSYHRQAGRLPGVEEYVYGLRRPTSLVIVCFILMEYGLGIELDDETLGSETVMRLQDAVMDHVALVNDVFSSEIEQRIGDHFSLPCVIFQERRAVQPAFTFEDAMREALSMIEEVDEECVQLIREVESNPKLMGKAGVRAYLRGLEMWMAGNLEWSLKTARYALSTTASLV